MVSQIFSAASRDYGAASRIRIFYKSDGVNTLGKIILITGGARSGKSTFAEKLALKLGDGRAAYIATAQIFDSEPAYRVKIHQARRGDI